MLKMPLILKIFGKTVIVYGLRFLRNESSDTASPIRMPVAVNRKTESQLN